MEFNCKRKQVAILTNARKRKFLTVDPSQSPEFIETIFDVSARNKAEKSDPRRVR